MNLVVHEPDFARLWDPAYAGPAAGSTIVDINVASRAAVNDLHERVVAAGFSRSVAPWDTFFGARYAIVRADLERGWSKRASVDLSGVDNC